MMPTEEDDVTAVVNLEDRRSIYTQTPLEVINDPNLADAAVRLYAKLKSYAIGKSICWPSQQTLANDLHWSISKVRCTTRNLVECGYITRIVSSEGRSNRYVFHQPPLVTTPQSNIDTPSELTGDPIRINGGTPSELTGGPHQKQRGGPSNLTGEVDKRNRRKEVEKKKEKKEKDLYDFAATKSPTALAPAVLLEVKPVEENEEPTNTQQVWEDKTIPLGKRIDAYYMNEVIASNGHHAEAWKQTLKGIKAIPGATTVAVLYQAAYATLGWKLNEVYPNGVNASGVKVGQRLAGIVRNVGAENVGLIINRMIAASANPIEGDPLSYLDVATRNQYQKQQTMAEKLAFVNHVSTDTLERLPDPLHVGYDQYGDSHGSYWWREELENAGTWTPDVEAVWNATNGKQLSRREAGVSIIDYPVRGT